MLVTISNGEMVDFHSVQTGSSVELKLTKFHSPDFLIDGGENPSNYLDYRKYPKVISK